MEERMLTVTLAILNLTIGISGAMILSRRFCPRHASTRLRVVAFLACLCVYFLECVAFPVGMATQVFVLPLAVVWGVALGLWLPFEAVPARPWRILMSVGLYTSAPTLTFCFLLPLACLWAGRSIVSSQAGMQFGIPDFIPMPFRTILGFCLLLGLGTLFLKCGITTATGLWVLRRRNNGVANQAIHAIGAEAAPQHDG